MKKENNSFGENIVQKFNDFLNYTLNKPFDFDGRKVKEFVDLGILENTERISITKKFKNFLDEKIKKNDVLAKLIESNLEIINNYYESLDKFLELVKKNSLKFLGSFFHFPKAILLVNKVLDSLVKVLTLKRNMIRENATPEQERFIWKKYNNDLNIAKHFLNKNLTGLNKLGKEFLNTIMKHSWLGIKFATKIAVIQEIIEQILKLAYDKDNSLVAQGMGLGNSKEVEKLSSATLRGVSLAESLLAKGKD